MDQVVGQEPVVRTLRRAIETGTGGARLPLQRAAGDGEDLYGEGAGDGAELRAGPTAEPDGTCDSCRAIVNNSSLDVVEMDAASNRGSTR
jgi:DNA polymerase-3 subunit gamma/tau